MKAFRKSSVPQLDIEAAGRILAQAFEANQMELNTIPLEVLASYSNYRRERFTLQRTILVIIMTLFLLLPFLFVPSSFSVQIQSFGPETGAADTCFNPVYRLEVDSFMLVERVNATVDGHNVPVYETDSHVYSIEPHQNGKMAVTVTLVNRQTSTQYVDVTTVDRYAPVATASKKEEDFIYLYLSDDISGVDYSGITAVTLAGEEIAPLAVDEEKGCITFPEFRDTINVYVPDLAGNKLHLILSIQ